MSYPEFHYSVTSQLRSSPEELWPIVSDTNRFNFDTGLSSVEELRDASTLTNARRRLKIEFLRIPIIWDEEPFEWIVAKPRKALSKSLSMEERAGSNNRDVDVLYRLCS